MIVSLLLISVAVVIIVWMLQKSLERSLVAFFRHYNDAEVHSSVTWDSLSLYLLSCKLWLVLVLAHPRFHLPGYYAGTWCWVPSLLWFIYIYVLLIYLLFHPCISCSPPPLLLLILFFRPNMHSLYCSNVMKEQEHRVLTGSSYWSWIVTVICSKLLKCDPNMTFRIKCLVLETLIPVCETS